MMKLTILAALTAGAALFSGAAAAQDYPFEWTPAGSVTPTPPAPAFLMLAGGSDQYEIESSRAVLETSSDAAIRGFAEMMVMHHSKTSQDAMTAARAAGLTPPPPMMARHQAAMVASLRMRDGAERDRLYLTQQMMAHKEALGLMQTYAESGETPELKAAAAAALPIIQRHLSEVERLISR